MGLKSTLARFSLADRVKTLCCDFMDPYCTDYLRHHVSSNIIFVSNPPYIPVEEMTLLHSQVKCWESTRALQSTGRFGLDIPVAVISFCADLLKAARPQAFLGLWMELHTRQPCQLQLQLQTADDSGLQVQVIEKDFSGRDRFCLVK